ncbi:MAG: hypothetical protein ACD_45C00602G0003 [uncultured bacterium]|nr:MAG: hypothetical protein ACD_45C00602G0003 [uncultured bacterium]
MDPWAERIVKREDFNNYIPELLGIIIENEKARAIAQEKQALKENALLRQQGMGYENPDDLKKEIRTASEKTVAYCEAAENNRKLVLDKLSIIKLTTQQKKNFLEKFYAEKDQLLQSLYPSKNKNK